MNKKKIINDPVYGFITITDEFLFDLVEHRYFQRLRRIRQLGLTELVYPGAIHTRFHHTLGALDLMTRAVTVLRQKGVEITDEEARAVYAGILLHDIGHGPFSHTLEHSIVSAVAHEHISQLFMEQLNKEFNGQLDLTLKIFKNQYPKTFLHQLISSQLDMDRLDYLGRDSFFTGVSEGVVGADRIINMLNVVDDSLVVEEKGIYSIEKFIIARRLMYWQVYLHKTVVAAEVLLIHILKRARDLAAAGESLFATPAFAFFLYNPVGPEDFSENSVALETFSELDDNDVWTSVKAWQHHKDKVLSMLCRNLIERRLPKIVISGKAVTQTQVKQAKAEVMQRLKLDETAVDYFVYSGSVENNAYKNEGIRINILRKDGSVVDVAEASDTYNLKALRETVKKYYLSYYR